LIESNLERTSKYVLLKVVVLHEHGVDPAAICSRAEFSLDEADGAIANVELVSITDVKVDQAVNAEATNKPKISPFLLEAIKAYR
jgi:hypothetical protein